MRAEANQFKNSIVELAIDQNQIGLKMTVPTIVKVTDKSMIARVWRQRLVLRQ